MRAHQALENLVNRLLSCDQETREDFAGLSGKTLQVELLNTSQPVISLLIEADGIRIDTDGEQQGDVLIRGTPLDFLLYLRSSGGEDPALAGDLEIIGDLDLAQDFQRLLRRFEIDWEEQAAPLLGGGLARKAVNLARLGVDFLQQLKNKVELDLSEYVLYEAELLPDRDEIERFNQAVEVLRDDLERLKQRAHKLSMKAPG